MKKLVYLFLIFCIISCNDGDFYIPSFDFNEDLNSCGEYVLYRTNSDKTEALILTLKKEYLKTDSYNVSNDIEITYRTFEDGFGSNYFCQSIPPSTPKILKELNADSKTIINILETIDTVIKIDTINVIKIDTIITSKYEINISDLLLKNDKNDKIYYENFDFGTLEISN